MGESTTVAEAKTINLSDAELFPVAEPVKEDTVVTPAPEAEAPVPVKEPEFEGQEEVLADLQRRFPGKPRKELLKQAWNSYRSLEAEYTKDRMKAAEERRNPPQAQPAPSVDDLSEKFREEFVSDPLGSSIQLTRTVLKQMLDERLGPIEQKTQQAEIQTALTQQYAEVVKEPFFNDVKDEMLAKINELEQQDPNYARAVSQRPDFLKRLYNETVGTKLPSLLDKAEELRKQGKERITREKQAAQVASGGVAPPAKPLSPEEIIRNGIINAAKGKSFG